MISSRYNYPVPIRRKLGRRSLRGNDGRSDREPYLRANAGQGRP